MRVITDSSHNYSRCCATVFKKLISLDLTNQQIKLILFNTHNELVSKSTQFLCTLTWLKKYCLHGYDFSKKGQKFLAFTAYYILAELKQIFGDDVIADENITLECNDFESCVPFECANKSTASLESVNPGPPPVKKSKITNSQSSEPVEKSKKTTKASNNSDQNTFDHQKFVTNNLDYMLQNFIKIRDSNENFINIYLMVYALTMILHCFPMCNEKYIMNVYQALKCLDSHFRDNSGCIDRTIIKDLLCSNIYYIEMSSKMFNMASNVFIKQF